MDLKNFTEVCQILCRYPGWFIWSIHDFIYFSLYGDKEINEDWNMKEEDKKRLQELGVLYDKEENSLMVIV